MMMGLIESASAMKAAETQMQASVAVAKKSLDAMEMQGNAALKLMESANVSQAKNTNGATGNLIDVTG